MKKNSKEIYVSSEILNQLNTIVEYGVSFIFSPSSYGKTTIMHEYEARCGEKFSWINVSYDNPRMFWEDFCDLIPAPWCDELRNTGYSPDEHKFEEIRKIFKKIKCDKTHFIVVDNYQLICDEKLDDFFAMISNAVPENMHIVILTQKLASEKLVALLKNGQINYISKEAFRFNADDIIRLFAVNDYRISRNEAIYIKEKTEGWIAAVLPFLDIFAATESVEGEYPIDKLIDITRWSLIDNIGRNKISAMALLDSFSIIDAMKINNIPEVQLVMTLSSSEFFSYSRSERLYRINRVFKKFLTDEFYRMSRENRKYYSDIIAEIFIERKDYLNAYRIYMENGEWDAIYASRPEYYDIYPYLNIGNREIFTSIIKHFPEEINESNFRFAAIICMVLFMYGDKKRKLKCIMDIVYSLEENESISERIKDKFLSYIYFIRGYTEFNNRPAMSNFFIKALEYTDAPIIEINKNIPIALGCPLIICPLLREDESAEDAISGTNEMLKYYHALVGNQGSGVGALLEAEIRFYQGDFKQSEILCHKALYQAELFDQTSLIISARLLLARLSIAKNDGKDYDAFKDELLAMKFMESRPLINEYYKMIGMCEAFLNIVIENRNNISEWLSGKNLFYKNINVAAAEFVYIFYGKHLYINETYGELIGVCEQLVERKSDLGTFVYKIYLLIYLCIGNVEVGSTTKALKYLDKAFKLAKRDEFVMPFVENFDLIKDLISKLDYSDEMYKFVRKVSRVAQTYEKNMKNIRRVSFNKDFLGLSKRELDVALLAAKKYTNNDIAHELSISINTVKSALKTVFSKLNIDNRKDLQKYLDIEK